MKTVAKLILYYFAYQLGCLGLFSLFTYAYYILISFSDTGLTIPELDSSTLFSINVYSMITGSLIYAWHLLHYRYVDHSKSTWSPVSAKILLIILPLTFGMMAWMNYLIEVIDIPDLYEQLFIQLKNNAWGIISIAIVAPVFEEILFRGAIEGHLLKIWHNPTYAIVVSALLFGIVHGNPVQIPFAFVLGLLMGWLFYATGSLIPGILLHFVNNMSSVVLALVCPESSGSMEEFFGKTTAIALSICGVLVSIVCIYAIHRMIRGQHRNIKETEIGQ